MFGGDCRRIVSVCRLLFLVVLGFGLIAVQSIQLPPRNRIASPFAAYACPSCSSKRRRRDCLKRIGVSPGAIHRQGDWPAICLLARSSELQPFTKPGILDLRFAVPEFGRELAVYFQISQPQHHSAYGLGKITPYIGCAHPQPGHFLSTLTGPYNHDAPIPCGRSGQDSTISERAHVCVSVSILTLECASPHARFILIVHFLALYVKQDRVTPFTKRLSSGN